MPDLVLPRPNWLAPLAVAAASTLALVACKKDAAPGGPSAEPRAEIAADAPMPLRRLKAQGQLGPGKGTLLIDVEAPKGAELTEGAPVTVHAGKSAMGLTLPGRTHLKLDSKQLPLRIPVDVEDGALSPARFDLTYYYCTKGEKASCRPERARLEVDLDLTGDAAGGEAHFTYRPVASGRS